MPKNIGIERKNENHCLIKSKIEKNLKNPPTSQNTKVPPHYNAKYAQKTKTKFKITT